MGVLVLLILPGLFLAQAARAAQPYHLVLEATPAAAFPYLGKFGSIGLHVYAGGVRAAATWTGGFSKNGDESVTVLNPLSRTHVALPLHDIAPTLTKLAGTAGALERSLAPIMGPTMKGTVRGIAATRHRLIYGPGGWIDVWTTDAIPENPQYRAIVDELVSGISPGTAKVARTIRGTPIYVELNFRRFKKVQLLKLKKLTFAADDEADALKLPRFYF